MHVVCAHVLRAGLPFDPMTSPFWYVVGNVRVNCIDKVLSDESGAKIRTLRQCVNMADQFIMHGQRGGASNKASVLHASQGTSTLKHPIV